jgi:metal transporter CNNM
MSFAVGASAYSNGLKCSRPMILTSFNLVFFAIACAPFAHAAPFDRPPFVTLKEGEGKPGEDPSLWVYLGTAVALVLLGGAFAGLTIAYALPSNYLLIKCTGS